MIEPALLQAIQVSRSFGEFQAVLPVNFSIASGEIIILTGPNGAGKSTLMHCLVGLLRPSTGNVLVEGYDLYRDEVDARHRLAFVPDVPRFYMELTTWEHLQFICLAFDVEHGWQERAEQILKEFNLWEGRHLYPHNLSRGMRLKLGIVLALIRPFKVLLMDEPTSALDPQSVQLLQDRLISLQSRGCSVLLTSHDLSIVEALGSRRWHMERGKLEMD